jgi:hypothetical protein
MNKKPIIKLIYGIIFCTLIIVSLAGCQRDMTGCNEDVIGCSEDEYSAGFERIGVLQSTDSGGTWTFLGNACFHAPELIPVDPSPLTSNSGIALYFLDLKTLDQKTGANRIIYRAMSSNGLEFSKPESVFLFGENITDPYIIKLTNSNYRMYLMHPIEPADIISATSQDGLVFTLDEGYRTKSGAIPGALLLPDGRIRLFVAGDPKGITSLISDDGLSFTMEEGVRIPLEGIRTTDPHPIQLRRGDYMMVYTVHREGTYADEQARLAAIEIRTATSEDGFNWNVNPTTIAYGSVPGLVETADGILYIYYVDASHRKNP